MIREVRSRPLADIRRKIDTKPPGDNRKGRSKALEAAAGNKDAKSASTANGSLKKRGRAAIMLMSVTPHGGSRKVASAGREALRPDNMQQGETAWRAEKTNTEIPNPISKSPNRRRCDRFRKSPRKGLAFPTTLFRPTVGIRPKSRSTTSAHSPTARRPS